MQTKAIGTWRFTVHCTHGIMVELTHPFLRVVILGALKRDGGLRKEQGSFTVRLGGKHFESRLLQIGSTNE